MYSNKKFISLQDCESCETILSSKDAGWSTEGITKAV